MARGRKPGRTPPSVADMGAIAEAQLASIPEPFRSLVKDVVIRVDEFPDAEIEDAMDLESPYDLLGLYSGVSLNQKSFSAAQSDVDMVFLYRQPILAYWCETGEDLTRIIRHVLIHEIGHHFGYSDEDMEQIEDQG